MFALKATPAHQKPYQGSAVLTELGWDEDCRAHTPLPWEGESPTLRWQQKGSLQKGAGSRTGLQGLGTMQFLQVNGAGSACSLPLLFLFPRRSGRDGLHALLRRGVCLHVSRHLQRWGQDDEEHREYHVPPLPARPAWLQGSNSPGQTRDKALCLLSATQRP